MNQVSTILAHRPPAPLPDNSKLISGAGGQNPCEGLIGSQAQGEKLSQMTSGLTKAAGHMEEKNLKEEL